MDADEVAVGLPCKFKVLYLQGLSVEMVWMKDKSSKVLEKQIVVSKVDGLKAVSGTVWPGWSLIPVPPHPTS